MFKYCYRTLSHLKNRQFKFSSTYTGLTGGQIIERKLNEKGVTDIFGYSGGAIMPVFDALYESKIRLTIPCHEQNLGHAACGYAKSSGKTPVCIVTSGPGLTNMITPMLDSHNDSTPMIVFSGNVPIKAMGTQAFQECPATDITKQFTKWSTVVKDVNDLPYIIDKAWYIAHSGKPGCVHIDLPKCITTSELVRNNNEFKPKLDENIYDQSEYNIMFSKIARLINKAKKPIIIAGKGCNNYSKELYNFVIKTNIPITTTLHAVGSFPETDYLSVKWLGMHGLPAANYAVSEADLIINIGSRFDDRTTGNTELYAPNAYKSFEINKGGIIHVNIEKTEFCKNINSHFNFHMDSKSFLDTITPMVISKNRSEWLEKINKWKLLYPFEITKPKNYDINTQMVIQTINKYLPKKKDWKITTGVGNHQMWTGQFIDYEKPNSLITSGSLGVMGAGIGYAIGAQIANPDNLIVLIDGDGSFNMTLSELRTINKYKLPIKICIMDDEQMSMVRTWEKLFFDERYVATELSGNPDYVSLSESFGIKSIKCDSSHNLEYTVEKFLNYPGPILCQFKTKSEMCYPLVSPGKALNDMILYQKKKNKIYDIDRSNVPS